MRRAVTLFTGSIVWLVTTPAVAEEAAPDVTAPRVGVRIEEPHAGVVEGPLVRFEASVTDPEIRHATLVANGASYDVPVEGGRISQRVIAVPGNNRVGVVVEREGLVARDSVTFRYDGDPMELVVIVTWPSEGEIIDLWVREPGGETCKWDHRQTASGGRLLDFSSNAIGFGSQAYVLETVTAGAFRIKLHYWGAFAHDDERGIYTYDELMRRLDENRDALRAATTERTRERLRAERRDLEARVDRWASPAAPQTPVHAEVVLFPGTTAERRWRFDRVMQRTGQLLTLGEVEITDLMIRQARDQRASR